MTWTHTRTVYLAHYSVMDSAGNQVSLTRTVQVNRPSLPQFAAAGSGDITISYGSAFAGADGNIFGTAAGTGFDAGNQAAIALGYFNTGFDLDANVQSEDVTALLADFNILHSTNFSAAAAPGFLATGGTVAAAGVGEKAYIFVASGVSDFASASSASEYGLFSDSALDIIPDGGSPVPSDWSIARLTYDNVLLGSEQIGGGFGNANAYLTQTVAEDGGGDDTILPVITIKGDAEITHEAATVYNDQGATASDDTDGEITDKIVVTGDDFNNKEVGEHLVRYNVTDAAGNKALEAIRKVMVQDTTIPQLLLIGQAEVSLSVGQAYNDAGVTASDTLDGDLTSEVIVGGDTVETASAGIYVLTFDVTDEAGNKASQVTRKVTVEAAPVEDIVAPVITLIGAPEISMIEGNAFTDPGATANDNVDGNLTDKIEIGSDDLDTNLVGTYFITYNVTDAAGNKAVQLMRKITVEAAETPDTTAPVITLKGEPETIVAQGSSYTDPGVTATDDRDGDLTDNVVIAGDLVDSFLPGIYNITYNLTDAAGNQAEEVVRKVTVQAADTLPPLLSLKGQSVVYITQGDVYTDAGATALDERDGDISSSIIVTGAI